MRTFGVQYRDYLSDNVIIVGSRLVLNILNMVTVFQMKIPPEKLEQEKAFREKAKTQNIRSDRLMFNDKRYLLLSGARG